MKPKRILLQICLLCAAVLHAVTSGAQTVTKISAGGYHSMFLKSDGSLWGMGYNEYGQLGDSTTNNNNLPEQIVDGGVTTIATGNDYSLFLKNDGSLWGMGYNLWGQFGDGTHNQTNLPEQILASGVTAIAAGSADSLFLKDDGSLWGMGLNAAGELGDGTYNQTNRPRQIVASGVTAIDAGNLYTLFLKDDGSLWAMGFNTYGELGDGTYSHTNLPEQIVASGVTAIAAGGTHSLFLKKDGSLWGMGANNYGQLGDGTYTPNGSGVNRPEQIVASGVTAIAAGSNHSLFLESDGSLWAMGWNQYGQLGDGTYNNTNRPEQIVPGGVTAIAAGGSHSLFLKSDGSLWAMGANSLGELGDGTYSFFGTNRPEQIVAGVALPTYQLSATTAGGGIVIPVPLLTDYPSGSLVTLTATPAGGWSFLDWKGDAQGANPVITLTMNSSKSAQARFGTVISNSVTSGGSITMTPSASLYPYGSSLWLIAQPQSGHYFLNWTNGVRGKVNPNRYAVQHANPTVSAVFAPLPPAQFAFTVIPNGNGSVAIGPRANIFTNNQTVMLTALPDDGQQFTGWSGDASGQDNPLVITMNASKVITANFTRKPFIAITRTLDDQGVLLTITGEFAGVYRVQTSADRINWTDLQTITNAYGESQLFEQFSTGTSGRFYRTVTP